MFAPTERVSIKSYRGNLFMNQKIVIVGLGLIGGSLAKAFHKHGGCRVAGIDTNPAVLKAALDCGANRPLSVGFAAVP